jgi:hypothetical protein
MPFRTPDTLPNERVGQGEQPYKDNREAMTQKDAELQAEAEKYGETHQRESGDEHHIDVILSHNDMYAPRCRDAKTELRYGQWRVQWRPGQ